MLYFFSQDPRQECHNSALQRSGFKDLKCDLGYARIWIGILHQLGTLQTKCLFSRISCTGQTHKHIRNWK